MRVKVTNIRMIFWELNFLQIVFVGSSIYLPIRAERDREIVKIDKNLES